MEQRDTGAARGFLSPDAPITAPDGGIVATVGGFWRWAWSDLIGSTERARLAKFIIACALGVEGVYRGSDEPCDLEMEGGVRVDVRAAGWVQSWHQSEPAMIVFGIQPTIAWDPEKDEYDTDRARRSDVFVFCVHDCKEPSAIDPLDIAQWKFYVVPTAAIDAEMEDKRTITMPKLIEIGAQETPYSGLKEAVLRFKR